jgi:enoyl reductase-like protein
LAAGIEFLSTPGRIAQGFLSAAEWCEQAIELIRSAVEPNPWKNATEEEIAAELLRRIEERKRAPSF